MYSGSFGVTLVALTMITTLVILAVTPTSFCHSVWSAHFRLSVSVTAIIKNRLDIAFLFWSIAVGIVLAAGLIPLAVFGSVAIGIFLLLFANRKASENPYIVVVQCRDAESEQQAASCLSQHTKKMVIKSKTARAGYIELIMKYVS